jgi:hypothetical protein
MTNYLIAAVAASTSITTPSGWTKLGGVGSGGSPPLGLYLVAPTVGTTAESFTVSGTNSGGVCAEFRGLFGISGAADGLASHGTGATGTSFTATASAPVASGELAVVALAIAATGTGSGLTSSTIPSGWNLAGSQPDTSTGDTAIAVYLYWKVGTASAPSAALTWTTTGSTPAFSTIITSIK